MAPKTLQVDPKDAVPIWKQIEHGVRRLVASKALTAGAPIPSVRDLSRELRVNPATVAKAYQRLTDAGVLTVRRGEGTFVADEPPALPRTERLKTLREAAARYVTVAVTLGASDLEAVAEVESAWVKTGRRLERGEAK
jgi:GntR family transcriptional regulator